MVLEFLEMLSHVGIQINVTSWPFGDDWIGTSTTLVLKKKHSQSTQKDTITSNLKDLKTWKAIKRGSLNTKSHLQKMTRDLEGISERKA